MESCLRDRHEFLKNLHAHWTAKLRDDVAEKDAELQKLTSERASDKEDYLEYRYILFILKLLLTLRYLLSRVRNYGNTGC